MASAPRVVLCGTIPRMVPEDLARGAVARVALGVVRRQTLALPVRVLERIPVERPRHVDLLSADTNHLLPVQQLLRKDGREAPEQVALAVDDDFLLKHGDVGLS